MNVFKIFFIFILCFISIAFSKSVKTPASKSLNFEGKINLLKFLAENIRFGKRLSRIGSSKQKLDFYFLVIKFLFQIKFSFKIQEF